MISDFHCHPDTRFYTQIYIYKYIYILDPVYNICKRILNQNLITFIVLSVSFNQKNPPGYCKVSEELSHEFVFEWVDTVYMCKQIIGKFDFQFPVGIIGSFFSFLLV